MTTLSAFLTSLSPLPANISQASALVLGSDGNLYKAPTAPLGRFPTLNVNASRLITLADAAGGILTSRSSGNVVLTMPTMWQMQYVHNTNNPVPPVWFFERGAAGSLMVVASQFLGNIASQTAMLALSSPAPQVGDYCIRTDLTNQVFILTTAGPATLANWTAVPLGDPMAPTSAGISFGVEWNTTYDTQYMTQDDPPISLRAIGIDSYKAG